MSALEGSALTPVRGLEMPPGTTNADFRAWEGPRPALDNVQRVHGWERIRSAGWVLLALVLLTLAFVVLFLVP